jgi:hypothetical protein
MVEQRYITLDFLILLKNDNMNRIYTDTRGLHGDTGNHHEHNLYFTVPGYREKTEDHFFVIFNLVQHATNAIYEGEKKQSTTNRNEVGALFLCCTF